MLVTSRRAAPEARHLGAYEVVFGAPDTEESARARARIPKSLSAELQVLRAQLEDIKRVLQLNNARAQGSDPEIDELYRELTAADLDTMSGAANHRPSLDAMAGAAPSATIGRWNRAAARLGRRIASASNYGLRRRSKSRNRTPTGS